MNTNSILRITTVIFACLSVILGAYIITDRINNPEPDTAAIAAGMGDDDHADTAAAGMGEDDHAEDDDHADADDADTAAAGMGEDDHAEGEEHDDADAADAADADTDTAAAVDAGMGDADHTHAEGAEGVEVSGWDAIPSISLDVIEDGHGGYVALASIANFEFTPENIDTPAAIGEGHAHIYVNGEKIARIYDSAYWLGKLEPGEYTISVGLNANDHQDLTLNGEVLSAEYVLTVEE